ncbi:MAG: hypothetical protein OSB57_07705 [Planctomycetota bacterium]|nr:hypothetical protein [Planctomycetota bacterium]
MASALPPQGQTGNRDGGGNTYTGVGEIEGELDGKQVVPAMKVPIQAYADGEARHRCPTRGEEGDGKEPRGRLIA